jgi:hypothetical protein
MCLNKAVSVARPYERVVRKHFPDWSKEQLNERIWACAGGTLELGCRPLIGVRLPASLGSPSEVRAEIQSLVGADVKVIVYPAA